MRIFSKRRRMAVAEFAAKATTLRPVFASGHEGHVVPVDWRREFDSAASVGTSSWKADAENWGWVVGAKVLTTDGQAAFTPFRRRPFALPGDVVTLRLGIRPARWTGNLRMSNELGEE